MEVQTEVENLTAQNRALPAFFRGEVPGGSGGPGGVPRGSRPWEKGGLYPSSWRCLPPTCGAPRARSSTPWRPPSRWRARSPSARRQPSACGGSPLRPKRGFFLNGEPYKIHGANVHQDHAGWSDAVTHTGIARDVKLIKDCGMNFIRGSHYPTTRCSPRSATARACCSGPENCFWGTGGPKQEGYWTASAYPIRQEDEAEFEESCLRSLEEMIHANRNHPSIVVWSMCNEPFFTDAGTSEKMKALLQKLVAASHRLDPTRPAALAGPSGAALTCWGMWPATTATAPPSSTTPAFPTLCRSTAARSATGPGTLPPTTPTA